jgi:hypothetical protein
MHVHGLARGAPARGAVREPALDGAEVVVGREGEPAVADVAEQALGVELAHVGVLGEETVALGERVWVLGRASVDS